MKKLLTLMAFLLIGFVVNGQDTSATLDTVTKGPISQLKAGSCASPDGPMNSTIITPPNYAWLQTNGYCNPNTYGTNPTVCWTFTPTSSSVTVNSGYSQSGCANISFGNFELYDASCTLISTGLNHTGLTAGNQYIFCMTGSAWGGGPSCTGFDDFCPYFLNVFALPIELVEFGVDYIDGINKLHWISASENNNDYYVLDRSTDAEIWTTISTINGAGNSNTPILYEFSDYTFSDEINYYRLTQVDYDGRFEEFDIISVDNRIKNKAELIKVVNIMGVEVKDDYKGLVIELYKNGDTRKLIRH